MRKREPIHLLMRFSDQLTGIEDTITAHQTVIHRDGTVWLGKMGKTLGRPHINKINAQCAEGIPTYLYLVKRVRGAYVVYCGTIVEVSRRVPNGQSRCVPRYYMTNRLLDFISFWVKLSEIKPLPNTALNRLLISNTMMAVPYSLPRSMSALFIVREGEGMRG